MNSNTHNQTSDNLPLSTRSILASTHLLSHLPSTIYNNPNVDFKKLSQQYAQYFFLSFRTTKQLPKITNLKLHLNIELTQHTMWEKVTKIIRITTYTFSILFLFCILLEKILTTINIL